MKKIGFSQSVLENVMDTYTKEAFDLYREGDVIEICCVEVEDLEKLNLIKLFVEKYSYKSIHLPMLNMIYKNDDKTNSVLKKTTDFYNSINAELILVHPDLVEDWSVFDKYDVNWAIENMDVKKENYKNLKDLKSFFNRRKEWNMVLDLNHSYSNDFSMNLAEDFIMEFKDKIKEIHLSGYIDFHEPLYKTKQNKIIDFCKKIDVPIIIESKFDSIDEIDKEMNYVKDFLVNN